MTDHLRRLAAPSVALFAIASSGVSIVNRFTYDDHYVIELNPLIHTLHQWWKGFASSYWPKDAGGDGYRPITILAYKLQWALGGGSPMVYHAANILLYAAVSLLVYYLARRLLPSAAAWLAGALFAVHPVHVEAVANVVGQAELLVAIAVVGAMLLYVRDRQAGPLRPGTAALIALLGAFACLAKEHGIVLLGLLAAAEVTIIDDPTPARERIRRLRPFYLALIAVDVAFVAWRSRVLASQSLGGFEPFLPFAVLHVSQVDRILTAVGVVPQWIRLLYWPWRLSADYGPPEIEIAQGPSVTLVPGLLLLISILWIAFLVRRRRPVISFGIAVICIALLPSSNFVLPAGIVLAERTLFLSSLGAMLVAADLAALAVAGVRARLTAGGFRGAMIGPAACAVVLAAGVARSVTRSMVWRDNPTLLLQTVRDAPDSYRAHYMLATYYLREQHDKRLAESEYLRALKLFPYDPYLAFTFAEAYRTSGECKAAVPLYRWTRELDPEFPTGRTQYAQCLLETGDFELAKTMALAAVRAGGSIRILHELIHEIDVGREATRRIDAGRNGSVAAIGAVRGKLPDTVQKSAPGPVASASR
jgi:tetratricopeptide (TPR) repeat protein